jgi:hypothetical protein
MKRTVGEQGLHFRRMQLLVSYLQFKGGSLVGKE